MESDNKEKTPRPNIFVSLQVPGNENTLEYLTRIRTLKCVHFRLTVKIFKGV